MLAGKNCRNNSIQEFVKIEFGLFLIVCTIKVSLIPLGSFKMKLTVQMYKAIYQKNVQLLLSTNFTTKCEMVLPSRTLTFLKKIVLFASMKAL